MTQMPGYPCSVCKRQSRGFTVNMPHLTPQFYQFCSSGCAQNFLRNGPLTPNESKAALAGGDDAGGYLDSIGKTDLATLTPDEWAVFCGKVFAGACSALAKWADDEIPF